MPRYEFTVDPERATNEQRTEWRDTIKLQTYVCGELSRLGYKISEFAIVGEPVDLPPIPEGHRTLIEKNLGVPLKILQK